MRVVSWQTEADVNWARDFIARCESVVETHGADFGSFVYEQLRKKLADVRDEENEWCEFECNRVRRTYCGTAGDAGAAACADAIRGRRTAR